MDKGVEIAELVEADTLKLPPDVAARFQPLDRFAVWVEGDTLHLKRITPAQVRERVAQADDEEPMRLDEINKIVHEVRRQWTAR